MKPNHADGTGRDTGEDAPASRSLRRGAERVPGMAKLRHGVAGVEPDYWHRPATALVRTPHSS